MDNLTFFFENEERDHYQYNQHNQQQLQQQQLQQQQLQQQQLQQQQQPQLQHHQQHSLSHLQHPSQHQCQYLQQHHLQPPPPQPHYDQLQRTRQHHAQYLQEYHQLKIPTANVATTTTAAAVQATPTKHHQHHQQEQQEQPKKQRQSSSSASSTKVVSKIGIPRKYFAIRKCHSLEAPAIFCSWEDCSYYVDSDDDDMNEVMDPEFQVFDHLQTAVDYIEIFIIQQQGGGREAERQGNFTTRSYTRISAPTPAADTDTDTEATIPSSSHRKRSAESAFSLGDSPSTQVPKQQRGDNPDRSLSRNRKKLPFASKVSTGGSNNRGSLGATSTNTPNLKIRSRRTSLETSQHSRTLNTKEEIEQEANQFERMLKMFRDSMAAKKGYNWNYELLSWVKKQRKEYNAFRNKSTNTTMTTDRLSRLAAAGFPFELKKSTKTWDERATQWLDYFTKHGKNPSRDANPDLCRWIYEQQRRYEERQSGKVNVLSDEKIKKLTEWGFKWESSLRASPEKAPLKTWAERFQELLEYKGIHGHTSPPFSPHGLGKWVYIQRCNYRKYLIGEKSTMTREKVAKLVKVGFVFTLPKRSPGEQQDQPDLQTKQHGDKLEQQQQNSESESIPKSTVKPRAPTLKDTTATTARNTDQNKNQASFQSPTVKTSSPSKKPQAPARRAPHHREPSDEVSTLLLSMVDDPLTLTTTTTTTPPATPTAPQKQGEGGAKNRRKDSKKKKPPPPPPRSTTAGATTTASVATAGASSGGASVRIASSSIARRDASSAASPGNVLGDNSQQQQPKTTATPMPREKTAREKEEERQFETMLAEFKKAKDSEEGYEGNFNILMWIHEQKKEYAIYQSNESLSSSSSSSNATKKQRKTTMTDDRFNRLTDAGFPFPKPTTMTWEERAAEWYEFHKKYNGAEPTWAGHRRVYAWVHEQRKRYKKRKNGARTNLTQERVEKLTSMGFVWEHHYRPRGPNQRLNESAKQDFQKWH